MSGVEANGMRILITDDHPEMRLLIKTLIGDLAEVFIECADGAEALPTYREHRPDWVIMDIKMPGLDGISATREISAAFPGARIIIATDYDDCRLRKAAFSAGACEYVIKDELIRLRDILTAGRVT
jgi:Response regulator containing a CheY-like receiver domain and an HTH DNA-binding domain